jgi:hypothetical protein
MIFLLDYDLVQNVPAVPIVQAVEAVFSGMRPDEAPDPRLKPTNFPTRLIPYDLNGWNLLNDLNCAFSAFSKASTLSP